ncbi:MAG: hypothetical protein AAB295_04380, partial [Chloroflexota bacterium]
MANFVYNRAAKRMLNGEILPGTHTFKLMLINSGYTPDRDHDFVSSGAGTVGGNEIVATNYAGGFGGAGRHALASPAWTESDALDAAVLDANDPATWASLGGATNDTIVAAVLITETGAADDSDTELIAGTTVEYAGFDSRVT